MLRVFCGCVLAFLAICIPSIEIAGVRQSNTRKKNEKQKKSDEERAANRMHHFPDAPSEIGSEKNFPGHSDGKSTPSDESQRDPVFDAIVTSGANTDVGEYEHDKLRQWEAEHAAPARASAVAHAHRSVSEEEFDRIMRAVAEHNKRISHMPGEVSRASSGLEGNNMRKVLRDSPDINEHPAREGEQMHKILRDSRDSSDHSSQGTTQVNTPEQEDEVQEVTLYETPEGLILPSIPNVSGPNRTSMYDAIQSIALAHSRYSHAPEVYPEEDSTDETLAPEALIQDMRVPGLSSPGRSSRYYKTKRNIRDHAPRGHEEPDAPEISTT